MKVVLKRIKGNQSGYTLVETMTALVILLSVLVPLTLAFNTAKTGKKAEMTVTASCILEQECAYLSMFPKKTLPLKKRRVNGEEWTVRCEVSSVKPLEKCRVKIENNRGISLESNFYRLNYEK